MLVGESTRGIKLEVPSQELAEELVGRFGGSIESAGPVWVVTLWAGPEEVREYLSGRGYLVVDGKWASLKEILRLLRRGTGIYVCPICGSPRIRRVGLSGWLTPPLYRCDDCGYLGRLVLLIEPERSNDA